ncbi:MULTISPECIES: hypothetical protein [Halorussus]|uniref:hypothetical protein n=1 Tax=Halorussus TaxID=1070314 RepID=UPI00209DFF86|nr:hypothetical protein [Halorussus vallis]USZ76194.1 hypothetical protein NGM07_02445 [Halorussus vallis]
MASRTATTDGDEVFDRFCDALTREKGGSHVYLKAAHVLGRSVGDCSLVGLVEGGDRVAYHWTTDEAFVSVVPFDETGVHASRGTTFELEADVASGASVGSALADVEFAWLHPAYRELLASA